MNSAALTIRGLAKSRGTRRVLDGVDLTVETGTVTAILGPSGAGKSTLLRAIAGLDSCDGGTITVGDETITAKTVNIPPEHRNIGMVFQDFSLFPHLTIMDNVMFGLRQGSKAARRERAIAMLALVHLDHRAHDYPHTLSGGEQQRIALARALAPAPSIILLDEAFSGLDSKLRAELRDATLSAIAAEGAAALMVTHDAEEAMYMADNLALMIDGAIIQSGPPAKVYLEPVSEGAARLLGQVNAWRGQVANGTMATPLGTFAKKDLDDGDAVFLIRPEGITISQDDTSVSAVTEAHVLGHCTALKVSEAGHIWHVRAPIDIAPKAGDHVRLTAMPGFYQVVRA